MTPSWRALEREIISILRSHQFHIESSHGETFVTIAALDFPMKFSLSTFAKELAERLEKV